MLFEEEASLLKEAKPEGTVIIHVSISDEAV